MSKLKLKPVAGAGREWRENGKEKRSVYGWLLADNSVQWRFHRARCQDVRIWTSANAIRAMWEIMGELATSLPAKGKK